jgi:hypothetical protein
VMFSVTIRSRTSVLLDFARQCGELLYYGR